MAEESKKNPKSFYKYVRSRIKPTSSVADLITESREIEDDHKKAVALYTFVMTTFTAESQENIPSMTSQLTNPSAISLSTLTMSSTS